VLKARRALSAWGEFRALPNRYVIWARSQTPRRNPKHRTGLLVGFPTPFPQFCQGKNTCAAESLALRFWQMKPVMAANHWTQRAPKPAARQELLEVRAAARDLAQQGQHAPGKARIVFQTVADVALISTAVISGSLAAVHLWRALTRSPREPHPGNTSESAGARASRYFSSGNFQAFFIFAVTWVCHLADCLGLSVNNSIGL
jgi:hypothetical protein